MQNPVRFLLIGGEDVAYRQVVAALRRAFSLADFTLATTMRQTTSALDDGHYDVAITAEDTPWMDGSELVRTLKAHYPQKPVIVYAAAGDQGTAVAVMKAGASDYLSRQTQAPEELVSAVRAVLQDVASREPEVVEATLQRREAILTALAFASRRLFAIGELDEVIPDVLARLGPVVAVSRVYVFANHRDTDGELLASLRYEWVAPAQASQLHNPELQNVPYEAGGFSRWRRLLAAGQIVYGRVEDFPVGERDFLAEQDVVSLAVVPIISGSAWWGFIGFDDCVQERSWTVSEIEALHSVAGALGAALESARLHQMARRRLAEQQALLEASNALSSSLDLPTVLSRLAAKMAEAVAVTSAYIGDWHPESGESTILADYYAPQASSRERVSDLGRTYLLKEEFGDPLEWLRTAQVRIVHSDAPEIDEKERAHLQQYGAKSTLAIPLVVREQVIGYAELWESRYRRNFTVEEITLAQGIAHQAAIALQNAQLFAAECRQLRLAQTLQQVGALLTTSLTLEEVFERIFVLLEQVVTYDSVSIQLRDEGNALRFAAGRGRLDVQSDSLECSAALNETLIASGTEKLLVIPDTAVHEAWCAGIETTQVRSWVAAKLTVKGLPIGILNVSSVTAGTYSAGTGETVLAFANQAAVAIENARLYEETRQRANELEIIHQIAVATATLVDIDELIAEITTFIANRIYRHVFGFLLLDETADAFKPHPSYHGLPPGGSETTVPIDKSVTGRVVCTGRPVVVSDVGKEELYFGIVPETRSEIAVPVSLDGRVIGVINVESFEYDAFTDNDLRFLTTLAGQVATAIERLHLYENLQQHAARLAKEVAMRTAELQSERDRTLAILDSAGEGIAFADCDATLIYVNRSMERQTGYRREECLGKNAFLWKSDKTPPAVIDEIWQAIAQGERWHGEVVNRRKDGALFDAALTITPLYGAEGELTGFVSVQADISRLKELDRLKSKFIANVSHELRTPLTNMKTYLLLLERGQAERRQHYLAVIHSEMERLAELIKDLLDLSQLDSKGRHLDLQARDLTVLLDRTANMFVGQMASKAITLRQEIPGDLPPLLADKAQLQQVLENLLTNALAYSEEGGRVTISAGCALRRNRPMVWFCFADEGLGIDTQDLPHLFERFYRGRAALENQQPGNGLGLSICREIVENHGGSIEVESAPDQGAVFTVWWPIAQANVEKPLAPLANPV
jgi:PAS domain S-box-containing protein